jgi:hypothetical protein
MQLSLALDGALELCRTKSRCPVILASRLATKNPLCLGREVLRFGENDIDRPFRQVFG